MKKLLTILALLLLPSIALAQMTTQQGGTGTTSPSGILIGVTGNLHLQTLGIGTGLTFTGGTLSATGGGSSTFGTTSLSAVAPLQYSTSLAQFSITRSGTAADGYLAQGDFQTFNNKISSTSLSVTTIGTSGAATYTPSTGVFNIPNYATIIPVSTSSSETSGYFPTWTTTNGTPAKLAGTSQIFQLGSNIGIGTASPGQTLTVNGAILSTLELIAPSSFISSYFPDAGNLQTFFNNASFALLTLNGVSTNVGVSSTTPWKELSVGTGTTGTFAIATSTAGCAQFSAFGELYSTGTTCGAGGITALTGDGTASGPGSSALTLATVNSNVGSFTNANVTVNAKGLITAVSNGSAGGATFGQAFDVDASKWLSATTTNTYGINANAQGTTFGYGIGDRLLAYASSTNLNTIFGLGAGGQNATTSATVASTTVFGYQAGNSLTTGVNNTFIGTNAGAKIVTNNANTAIGSGALSALANDIASYGNTVIGYNAGSNLNGIFTGSNIIIGADVLAQVGTSAGQLNIGNSIFGTGMYGDQSTPSNTPQTSAKIGIATSSQGTLLSTLVVGGNQTIGADYQKAAPTNGLLVEGKVGFGTTSPYALLSLNAPAQTTPYFAIGSTTSEVYNISPSANPFMGIGTTSPFATLSVNAPSTISPLAVAGNGVQFMQIDSKGHLITGGSAPSCGTGCASVTGDDRTMRVLSGTAVTSVTVNFANTYITSPVCIATEDENATIGIIDASTTPTTIVITSSVTLTAKHLGLICQNSSGFTY